MKLLYLLFLSGLLFSKIYSQHHTYHPDIPRSHVQGLTPEQQIEFDKQLVKKNNPKLYAKMYWDYGCKYKFSDLSMWTNAKYFYDSYKYLCKMLEGKIPINIKNAVISIENAYYENKLDKQIFERRINQDINICKLKLSENIYDKSDFHKNLVIFSCLTNTLRVKDNYAEKELTNTPVKYDFEDFNGKKDWTKMFVSKLLKSNSGQCNSMPLYYLILSEKLNCNSFLSFAPNHSFIKFKDSDENWYNAELTRGFIISDASFIQNSQIKSEAIRSKIYMNPVSKKEVIAHLITYMGNTFIKKFGYRDFAKRCFETTLKYFPNDIHAEIALSNFKTNLVLYLAEQRKCKSLKELWEDERAKKIWTDMQNSYNSIESKGYEQMSEEDYKRWLERLEKSKNTTLNLKITQ